MRNLILISLSLLTSGLAKAQTAGISGTITSNAQPVTFAHIGLSGTSYGTSSGEKGDFNIANIPPGAYTIMVSIIGYERFEKKLLLQAGEQVALHIHLQESPTRLDEIVVTGVSKATLARESPVAITAISSGQIERTSESNLIDALVKNVPGLHAVKTGPNISKPFIRGLGYNRVLTLYDGIRQEGQQWGDEHGIELDAYHVDKAEVIKGPASMMYGSDALAGVVAFFPYLPKGNNGAIHGKVTTEYQTNNNLLGNGLRLGYSNGHLSLSASGSYRLAKNYRNPVDGRVYLSNFDEKNLSMLLGYQSAKGYTHLNFTLYDSKQGIPDGSRDSLTRKFTKQIFEGNDDDIKERPVVSKRELNAFTIPVLSQHIQHYRTYLHSFYKVGRGDIDAMLGFQQNVRREYAHPTMPEQAGMYVQLNTFNYGLRYNAPNFRRIELSAGLNGMLQSNKHMDATDFPIPGYRLYDGGLFVYGKWKHNRWSVSGGIRYDIRHVDWGSFYTGTNPNTGFEQQVHWPDITDAVLQFDAYQKTFHGASASLGTTFRATENISLKANIGRAYRSPNITEIGSNGLDPGAHIIYLGNRNFSPEFSLQEDVGILGKFNDFSFEASLFNNHIQDFIYLTMVVDDQGNPVKDAQHNRTYQYQQSKAQLYGGELWFAFHPEKLKGFRLDYSLDMVYGFNRKPQYKNKGPEGAYLPLIPPMKIMSSISREFTPKTKPDISITPKFEVAYHAAQNRYLGLNGTETATPSYTLFHAGMSVTVHALQFVFQVNNLFDKAYQSHLSRLKYFEYYEQSPGGHTGIYNMGRNTSMKIILRF